MAIRLAPLLDGSPPPSSRKWGHGVFMDIKIEKNLALLIGLVVLNWLAVAWIWIELR